MAALRAILVRRLTVDSPIGVRVDDLLRDPVTLVLSTRELLVDVYRAAGVVKAVPTRPDLVVGPHGPRSIAVGAQPGAPQGLDTALEQGGFPLVELMSCRLMVV